MHTVLTIASKLSRLMGATLLCFAGVTSVHAAISINDLGLSQEEKQALLYQLNSPAGAPGIAFGSPVGYGLSWGSFGLGFAGQTTDNSAPTGSGEDGVDASMSAAMGFGDARRWVGFEAAVNLLSTQDDQFSDGSVNLKLHTALPGRIGFAVGAENVGRFGDAEGSSSSVYAVGTKIVHLRPESPTNKLPLSINIGVGDNRFESNGNDGVGAFGSLGLMFHRQASAVIDWTGRDVNAAVSLVPLRRYPFTITLGAINLAERLGNGTEFSGAIGYSFRF